MNVIGTQYTLNNRAFEIYLAGCNANPHCPCCHNPESWDFNAGEKCDEQYMSNLCEKIVVFGSMIDNIWIIGGDPLDQDITELLDLIIFLRYTKKKIWIFTRYEFEKIPDIIKKYSDYIKTGRYKKELNPYKVGNIQLASNNQKLYKKTEQGWQVCE